MSKPWSSSQLYQETSSRFFRDPFRYLRGRELGRQEERAACTPKKNRTDLAVSATDYCTLVI